MATGDSKAEAALVRLVGLLEEGASIHPPIVVVQRLLLRGQEAARDLLLDVLDGERKDAIYNSWPWSSGHYDLVNAAGLWSSLLEWTNDLESSEGADEASRVAKAQAWVETTSSGSARERTSASSPRLPPCPSWGSCPKSVGGLTGLTFRGRTKW